MFTVGRKKYSNAKENVWEMCLAYTRKMEFHFPLSYQIRQFSQTMKQNNRFIWLCCLVIILFRVASIFKLENEACFI